MKTTVVIQIGNSDNKLTQQDWGHYWAATKEVVERYVTQVHFTGASDSVSPFQNACWVCDIEDVQCDFLFRALRPLLQAFEQDSIAVTTGDTLFITRVGNLPEVDADHCPTCGRVRGGP